MNYGYDLFMIINNVINSMFNAHENATRKSPELDNQISKIYAVYGELDEELKKLEDMIQ